jgi:hypothetical protein
MRTLLVAIIAGLFCATGQAQTVSPLFARGYTVIPEPQKVSLIAHDFTFGQSWQLKLGENVAENDVAVETLREDLATRFNSVTNASLRRVKMTLSCLINAQVNWMLVSSE